MFGLILVCSFCKTSLYLEHYVWISVQVCLLHGCSSQLKMQGNFAPGLSLFRTLEILGLCQAAIMVFESLSLYHSLVNFGYSLCGQHGVCHVRKRDEACSVAFQRTDRGQILTLSRDQL